MGVRANGRAGFPVEGLSHHSAVVWRVRRSPPRMDDVKIGAEPSAMSIAARAASAASSELSAARMVFSGRRPGALGSAAWVRGREVAD